MTLTLDNGIFDPHSWVRAPHALTGKALGLITCKEFQVIVLSEKRFFKFGSLPDFELSSCQECDNNLRRDR